MIIGNGRGSASGSMAARVVLVGALITITASIGMFSLPASAQASVASSGAGPIADAAKAPGTAVTGASFVSVPSTGDPTPTPNGIGDSAMAGFPTDGSTFGILTTGDVNFADDAPPSTHTGLGLDIGGGNVRGDTDFDVSILKIDFTVGAGMNCVRFDFRFFTEEFPEAVGLEFNDAFIAELDSSTWTTSGSTISAPNNFAFDPANEPITVNATGATSMVAGPNDTTYDGATPLLTAAHEVTPGAHSLYLSIFDQADHLFDSAVFVDNVVVGHAPDPDEQCVPGAAPKEFELALTPSTATNTVGESHSVTASLHDLTPAGPIEDATILFTVSGANTASGEASTDSAGMATFSYTGAHAGTDAITACYDVDGNDSCDGGEPLATVSKTWTAAAPSPSPSRTGHNGLPITGAPAGLVAGVGALTLLLGLAGYVIIRRRRIRFVSE